ncbi:MAG TPA: hypothetical protein VFQ15_05970, partial [Jiangellaceae bacterium]|nr:hypothetical protein [Jiangellaceae bacterium]
MSESNQVFGYGFQSGAYDSRRNKITTMHVAGNGQVAEFDVASRTWQVSSGTGERPGDGAHNCSLAYDPVNDRFWLSSCAPQPVPGAFYWAAGTKAFTRYDAAVWPACSIDALMAYDPQGQAIYCLGGYTNTFKRVHRLQVAAGATSAAAWQLVTEGGGPSLNTEGARLSYTRGGWDPTARNIWVIDDGGDLWRFDPATLAWTHQPTSGPRPAADTVFGLDDGARMVVGWAGLNTDRTTLIQQTWLLNLATMTWTPGPSGDVGTPTASTPQSMSAYTFGPGGKACFFISTGPMRVWCFVVPTGPPPAPTPVTLTLSTAGTGSGSVSGAGTYTSGTQVTLGATPAAGSTFTGWTGESDCLDGVVNLDRSKSCVANFAPTAPPPNPGNYQPTPFPASMPVAQFVPIPCDPRFDNSPWPCSGGSKHQRWATDGQGNIWSGFGDTSPSKHAGNPSQNQGYRLNVATGQWTRWNPACRPPGQIMPGFPDEVIWAHDERGYFWLLGGITQGLDGAICNSGAGESGAAMFKTGLFRYDPATDRWERFTGVAGTNALWGHFDNRTKNLLYLGGSNTTVCGSALYRLNVDTLQLTSTPACFSTRPFPGTPQGTFEDYPDLRIHASAWDEAGRTLYVMGYHNQKVASETSGFPVLHLWAINVDTGQISLMPDPPIAATR